MPTTLLFRDGVLVDRRLGAQSIEDLRDWVHPAEPASQRSFQGAAVSRSMMLSESAQRPRPRPRPSLKVELLLILIVSVAALAIVVAHGQ
jgi:thioredoxin-like negative regulator of GroEL